MPRVLRVVLVAVVALSVAATGCAPDSEAPPSADSDLGLGEVEAPDPTAPEQTESQAQTEAEAPQDPSPEGLGVVQQVVLGSSGGVLEAGGAVVRVPAGATGDLVEVEIREPLGVFGTEEGGAVVGVEHDGPLVAPVKVSWDVSHLSDAQQDLILVVRWNEDSQGWLPVDVDYEVTAGVLTAEIAQWSWASWITGLEDFAANFSQTVQEILGRRVDAPKCSGELPAWVTRTVQPDGANAAAIRLCYEARDSASVRMKMANNRVFSQFVYSKTPGVWGDEVEGPDPSVSLVGVLHQAAHMVLSDDSRVFMPPLTEAEVSIERPQGTIPWHITFSRDHDAQSFLADVAFFAASALPTPSGAGTFGYIQVYLTVLFECSVVRVTDEAVGARSALEVFLAAVRATASCSAEMSVPASDQNRKVLSRIVKQGLSKSEFKRYFSNKAARTVAGALKALKIGEAIGYFIDLAADEWVESTTWSLSITGHEARLGDWEPTCSSPEGDANQLSRNLVFREPFTDVSNSRVRGRLHTLDNWRSSAEQAVEPLNECGDSHNTQVADAVDDWWTDTDAASDAIVSGLIRAMVSPDPTGGYTAVAAGGSHSCGLRPDRAVACWGSNTNGQLLEPDSEYYAVTAGAYHNCGIRSDGTVACWGSNNNRQLNTPAGQFIAVTAADNHSCGIRNDSTVECWGGYITAGTVEPFTGSHATSPDGDYSAIAAGTFHTCAIAHGGAVECWGTNNNGQLDAPTGRFDAIAAGSNFTCAISSSGTVQCWGSNNNGQLNTPPGRFSAVTAGWSHACGLRTDDTIVCWGNDAQRRLDAPSGQFDAVSAGESHTCALRGGTLVCWGNDTHGETNPPAEYDTTPVATATPGAVSAGRFHTCALTTDSSIVCWGADGDGRTDPPGGTFRALSAGDLHSCALRANNSVTCWGSNSASQTDAPDRSFESVAAGNMHSCGLRTNNTIECWGSNFYGQTDAPSGNFQAVTAGGGHSCAIHADGTIECWGDDSFGRTDAPDGTYIAISASKNHTCALRTNNTATCWGSLGPEADAPQGTYSIISAGGNHTCALRTNNTIECWGNNDHGQTNAPQGTFTDITAGMNEFARSHSCALRTDNTVICWGDNTHSQAEPPRDSIYTTTFKAFDAGYRHGCGLSTDDTIACWGNNDYGQSDAPQGAFKSVTAGDWHGCGLRTDDTIECWGTGSYSDRPIDAPSGTFKSVTAGGWQSCGLRSDATIACWDDSGAFSGRTVCTELSSVGYTCQEWGEFDLPSGTFKSVTVGGGHSCGLRTDDTIVCWGNNSDGQSDPPQGAFKSVTAAGRASFLNSHSCGIRTDDTVTCWGYGYNRGEQPPSGTFRAISADGGHTCGLRTDDTIECWGRYYERQSDPPSGTFKSVTSGQDHSCGLRTDNTIECWGSPVGWTGWTGFGDRAGFKAVATSSGSCGIRIDDGAIVCVGFYNAPFGTFKSVTSSGNHACGLRADDTIACWGYNRDGQANPPSGSFKSVTAGYYHSCALETDDSIICWGANDFGRANPPSGNYRAITAGRDHSCALKTDDTIICWGANDFGQANPPSGNFRAITAGGEHSCGLRTDYAIVCWGNNDDGQTDAPNRNYIAVSAGGRFSCGIQADNTIACWGRTYGEPPSGVFRAVSASELDVCALHRDGTITCWGPPPHRGIVTGRLLCSSAGHLSSSRLSDLQNFNSSIVWSKPDKPVGVGNCVVARQMAFRYSLMSPPQRAVLMMWRCPSGRSAASVATGGSWSSERWGSLGPQELRPCESSTWMWGPVGVALGHSVR